MPKKKNIRVAFIGCGEFCERQIRNLSKIDSTVGVAIYDKDMEILEKTGVFLPKARMYQDIEKMFLKERIDAVVIDSAQSNEGYIEGICCKKGIHMFFKNPIAISNANAWEVNEKITFSNIITAVDYYERYSVHIHTVKELLKKDPAFMANAFWVQTQKEGMNAKEKFLDYTSHMVDMLCYLFSQCIESVVLNSNIENEEGIVDENPSLSAVLKFKNGLLVNLQSSFLSTNEGATKKGFEIFTPRCKIEYKWSQSLTVSYGDRSEQFLIYNDEGLACLREFVEACREGEQYRVKTDYKNAMESLKLALKLIEEANI